MTEGLTGAIIGAVVAIAGFLVGAWTGRRR